MLNINSDKFTEEAFLAKFEPHSFSIIIENNAETLKNVQLIAKKLAHITPPISFEAINDSAFLLPFLTVHENLLLGIRRKHLPLAKKQLATYLRLCQLDQTILLKKENELSATDSLKLKLIQALLVHKDTLLIYDSIDQLPIKSLQTMLPLLKILSKKAAVRILLFTEKQELAATSFPDQVIVHT